MGLKDSIKRIFGSQDKKKKSKETVSKEPEPDYDDNCELCRANREGRPDHHTGHSSPDLTGKGIGPTKKPQERAVEANGSKDATNLGGQPQESFGRVPKDVSKPDDTKLRDTKEDKSTNKDQDTISKEPGDIQALDRRAGMDEARSPDLDRTTGDDLEHEKGFVGVGRTPGPSTTLMSDTKNAEDLNPFDNVPGTHGPHKPEAAKDTHGETSGEEVPKQFWDPGVSPKSPARAKNHNPFRTQGLSAQSEGLKADNGVPASTAGAALFGVGAGAAGAGAYAAREGNHGKGSSGIIAPTGVPGALHPDSARSPSTRRTPSPLDRSGDRFAPPSPPLSEHDRSIELGMRDEIDSQRFDPSRETTPLGHKEDHKNEDHHREEEFAVGGAGVGAGILGAGALAASRDKEDKDGKDEGKGREGREGKRLGPDEPVGPRARGGVPVSKDTTRDAETGVPDTRVFGTTGAGSAQRQAENGSGLGKSQENTDKPSDMRAQPGLGTGIAAGTALGGVAGATVAMNRQGTGHEDTGRDLNGGTNTTKNVTDARVSQPSNAMVEDVLTEDDTMGEDSMKPTSESARTGAGSGDDSGLSPYVSSQVGRGKNEGSVLPTEREEGSSLGIQQAQGEPSAMSANTSHQHHALAAGVAGATGAGVAATALGHERRGQGDNATAQPGSGSPPVSAMGTQRASRNAFMSGDTRDIHKSKTGEQFRVPDQFDEHGPSLVPISERPMESAPPAEDIAEEDDHGMIACHHALATQRASAEPARDLRQGVGAATTRSAPGPPPVRAMGAQRAIRNASKAGDTGAFHESPLKPREIPDQFDEHGSCLVLPSEKSMESSASDEDIAEEDDHGMIACHHALATQRAFTQPSRDSHATSGLAAAGAGAAGAAIAAPTHFAKSPTDTTSKASSGRPRLHTIPGTRAPITEETSELPKAKAPQRRTTIPGTGALISDDDEELKDVMAPSSTGGLLVPTAAVAEQSILGEQTSRVAGVGNEPNTMDLSGITELDDSGAERSLSTLDEEPDAPHLGHPSGIESAALAGGAFVTAGGYGLHHAQGSSLRSPGMSQWNVPVPVTDQSNSVTFPLPSSTTEMGQTKQQSHETNPPSNAQSAHLSDQISGTPSDEEAWTKLPSEPKQEESTVDSESQYSVDSQQATFSGDRKEHNTRKADTSLTEGIGLAAGSVLGSIAGHLPAMPTIPGTSWGGAEDVSQDPGNQSRSIAEPSISAISGNAPSKDINPSRSEPSLTQSGDSFRDSRHSEAMPGDWNMETTEEALGDSDAVAPPAEKPVPSTRKESPEIRIDPLSQKSSDTAPERLSPSQGGASSPKAGSPDAVTQELERQQAGPRPPRLSFDSFEAALTRNERENLSLTPRAPREATLAQQGIGSTQSQATRRTGHNGEGETGGTRAETRAGTAGLNLNGSGKSSAPRPEPSGVATIEEPYIYRRPGSLIGRPEVGIHNGVDSGPNTLLDSGKHEVGLTEEASDYETEEEQEEEPLLFRRDVAENQHVFTSVPHADPVFDKEVVDHQEHYSDNIVTHDLTQDLAHTGQV